MSQSLANILIHLVFSTKERQRLLRDDARSELHAYIAGILRNHHCQVIEMNSVDDHIHLLFAITKTEPLAKIVEQVKSHSSFWLKDQGRAAADFAWQRGYGAFSVSPAHVGIVRRYIQNQRDHHAKVSFMDEFRRLCQKNLVPLDERYAWD